jgi:hypothetical protein
MKPAEIFGIIVRTVGLVVVLFGLSQLYTAVLNLFLGPLEIVVARFPFGVAALLIGLWLLRGAKALIKFAYCD